MKAGLVRQISVSKVIPAPINSDIYRQPGAEDGLDVETFNADWKRKKRRPWNWTPCVSACWRRWEAGRE
jgi:hypothetical protein